MASAVIREQHVIRIRRWGGEAAIQRRGGLRK